MERSLGSRRSAPPESVDANVATKFWRWLSYLERHGVVHIQHDTTLIAKACKIVCGGTQHSVVLLRTHLCQILSANGLYFLNRVCMLQSQAAVQFLISSADGNAVAQTSVLNRNILFHVGSVLKEKLLPAACPSGTHYPHRRPFLHQSAQTPTLIVNASSPLYALTYPFPHSKPLFILHPTTLLMKACAAVCANCKLGMFVLQTLSHLRIYILTHKYSEQKEAVAIFLVAFSDGHNSVNIHGPTRYIFTMVGSALKRLQHTTRSNRRFHRTTHHSNVQNKRTPFCFNGTKTLADSNTAVTLDAFT
jgi:hypothetical protein